MSEPSQFLLYTAPDGAVRVDVFFREETVWLTQKALAELFGVKVPAINKHLKNIFESGELAENSVVSILETTAADGKNYQTRYYNLDAIIAVGYVGSVRIPGSRQISRQSVARNVVEDRNMNRDMMSRFGGDSGGKLGIPTEIPTKCRDFALVERGEAQSRQLSRHHVQFGRKEDLGMGRPFRAWNPVGDETQGAALGCRVMPRWGVGKEPGERLNKERRYPIALPMRGPLGSGLPRFMGFPWTSADGFRRSLIGIAPLGRKKGTHAAFGCE